MIRHYKYFSLYSYSFGYCVFHISFRLSVLRERAFSDLHFDFFYYYFILFACTSICMCSFRSFCFRSESSFFLNLVFSDIFVLLLAFFYFILFLDADRESNVLLSLWLHIYFYFRWCCWWVWFLLFRAPGFWKGIQMITISKTSFFCLHNTVHRNVIKNGFTTDK